MLGVKLRQLACDSHQIFLVEHQTGSILCCTLVCTPYHHHLTHAHAVRMAATFTAQYVLAAEGHLVVKVVPGIDLFTIDS